MLAPLTRITDATRMAANGSLSHRVRLPGRRDEFRELADAFDTMLARLEAHVAEQQRFAANASHELRTPLAITQTLLDVARSDPNRDSGALDERLRAVNARAMDLTEALLLLSRTDQRSFTREHVDLSLIAEEAAETLLPLAEKRGVTIETSGDITPTVGSHALLLQMTTNLLHNAIVHNLPEHGTVQLSTAIGPESVMLTVENTGDKLAPQLVSTLTEPFQRGAGRTRGDHAGVGLGLAIVKSITQAHDGTLTLAPRAAGGLCVTRNYPSRHRTLADDDQRSRRTAPRGGPARGSPGVVRQGREAMINPLVQAVAPRLLWHDRAAGWRPGHGIAGQPGAGASVLPYAVAMRRAAVRTTCRMVLSCSARTDWPAAVIWYGRRRSSVSSGRIQPRFSSRDSAPYKVPGSILTSLNAATSVIIA